MGSVLDQWRNPELSTQVQILATHAFWCQYFRESGSQSQKKGLEEFRKTITEMEAYSCKCIRDDDQSTTQNRANGNREVAKLFLLQYYQDMLRKRIDGQKPTLEDMYRRMVMRYSWLKEQKIFCCSSQMQGM